MGERGVIKVGNASGAGVEIGKGSGGVGERGMTKVGNDGGTGVAGGRG